MRWGGYVTRDFVRDFRKLFSWLRRTFSKEFREAEEYVKLSREVYGGIIEHPAHVSKPLEG